MKNIIDKLKKTVDETIDFLEDRNLISDPLKIRKLDTVEVNFILNNINKITKANQKIYDYYKYESLLHGINRKVFIDILDPSLNK